MKLLTNLYSGENLKNKIIRSATYIFFGFGGQKILQLVSNLILTRLLFPEAFGLMSLVFVFITGVNLISDVGIKPAVIIADDKNDETFLNTAWTLQILRGVGVWLTLCLISYPCALIYDEPQLVPLLCFTGLSAVITGFLSINSILAEKNLNIKKVEIIRFLSYLLSFMTVIPVAYFFKSVWALAIGAIVSAFINVVAGHIFLKGHKHSFQLNKSHATTIFKFGKWILWGTLVTYIGGQGSQAIQGALVPMADLGIISIAGIIAWSVGDLMQKILGSVLFPALSKIGRDNSSKLPESIHKARIVMLFSAIPLFGILTIFSNQIFSLLYDERYAVGGVYLAILAIGSAFGTLPMIYQNALLATGDSRAHFLISTVSMILRVSGIIGGFYAFGIIGMLIGGAASRLLTFIFTCLWIKGRGWITLRYDILAPVTIMLLASGAYVINT